MNDTVKENNPVRYDLIAPRVADGQVDLSTMIKGDGPIELDIGFGRGRSLFERSLASPTSRIIGFEVKSKCVVKVMERCERKHIENIRAFYGDAREILARSGPEGVVRRVFIHFPDPWWKKRHAKRQVVGVDLLDSLSRLLMSRGKIFIQTDVEERAHEYIEAIRQCKAFELKGQTGLIDFNPFDSRSNREFSAEEVGLPIYRILARRL